jgi:transposase-like protein
MTEIKCPYCNSADVKHDPISLSIDVDRRIHVYDYECRTCGKSFAVEYDEGDGTIVIIVPDEGV